ncbi:arginase family protein [Bacillus sp. FJAT-29814]|uniref:arginase family protein n=1 Tax=Bacillus sp. FJAT-29814 TaxID=1729688 RepID=UPI00082B66AB|nr:arginase family protein [Bacillus sp. FJAT-29814]
MGLLRKGISILHFDEQYFCQNKLLQAEHENLDFRKINHVNLYCENRSLRQIEVGLKNRGQKGITFIGNGNYHYVSFLLLKELTNPFTLVLFDNHPDLGSTQPLDESLLSCGTWVSYALKQLPLLQRVVIIGPTTFMNHCPNSPRVVIFPFDGRHQYSIKSILSTIHTKNVYVSIDKDVLCGTDVTTNWDQGIMTTDILTEYLEVLLKQKQVEGIDICGEAQISSVNAFLPYYQTLIRKNERVNLKILETCLNNGYQQTQSIS